MAREKYEKISTTSPTPAYVQGITCKVDYIPAEDVDGKSSDNTTLERRVSFNVSVEIVDDGKEYEPGAVIGRQGVTVHRKSVFD